MHSSDTPPNEDAQSDFLVSELGAMWAFFRSRIGSSGASEGKPHRTPGGLPTRAEFEADLARRARTDAAFLLELQTNPTAVFVREVAALGIALPDDVRVHLHEETPTALHLVLPDDPEPADAELDLEALDQVVGGATDPASAAASWLSNR